MDSALPVLSNVGNFEEETETLSSNGNDFDFVSVVKLLVFVLPEENLIERKTILSQTKNSKIAVRV